MVQSNPSKKAARAAKKRYNARQRGIWFETPGDARSGSLAGGNARVMRLGSRGTYMAPLSAVRNPCYGLHFHSRDMSKVMKAKGRSCNCNPSKGKVDLVAATELFLYADNDGQLYRQQGVAIRKNLSKKWKKGTYDSKKAVKLWMYLMESAAKKYHKEFGGGGTWYSMFNVPTREAAAKEAAGAWEGEMEVGNFHNPAPVQNMTKAQMKKVVDEYARKAKAAQRRAQGPVGRAKAAARRAASKLRSLTPSARRIEKKRIEANRAAARLRDSQYNPSDSAGLYVEDGSTKVYIANPSNWSYAQKAWLFQFGAYGSTRVAVWEPHLEGALEIAAEWLADHAPGIFTDDEEIGELEGEYGEVVDHTYTESGYIPSWEWHVDELTGGKLARKIVTATVKHEVAEDGDLDESGQRIYKQMLRNTKGNPSYAAKAVERVQENRSRRAKYRRGAPVRNLMKAVVNPGGGLMSKREFEGMFKDMVLPGVVETYEMDGVPDRPARREAWNDYVDFYIQDGMLPAKAENWSHPRWLETHVPRGTYVNPHGRKYTERSRAGARAGVGAGLGLLALGPIGGVAGAAIGAGTTKPNPEAAWEIDITEGTDGTRHFSVHHYGKMVAGGSGFASDATAERYARRYMKSSLGVERPETKGGLQVNYISASAKKVKTNATKKKKSVAKKRQGAAKRKKGAAKRKR